MPLSDDALNALLDGRHVAVLATIDRHGRPHQAPVWYLWRDGRALVVTERRSQKARNIERHAEVSLCVDTKQPPYEVAVIQGRAVESERDFQAARLALWEHYVGAEEARCVVTERPTDDTVSVLYEIIPDRIISSG
jgi:PPOX class probable F420-dependent enzyme